ncbi:MAG: hypothetical protein WC554_12325 [Clostridia bacterium]
MKTFIQGALITLCGILFIIISLLNTKNVNSEKYENTRFVVEEKGDYNNKYFLLRIYDPDTLKYIDMNNKIMFIINKLDTLYTVLNEQNYMYNESIKWDQFYFSTNIKDTLTLTIKKKKCWRKL